jgi:outer membrane protein assembly factor BamB
MSSPPPRRRRRGLLVALGVVVVLGAGVAAFIALATPHDVSHPNVEFTAPTTATHPAVTTPQKPVDTALWQTYGFTPPRTRDYSGAPADLHAPFHRGWTYRGTALLEFPPAIEGPSLYVLDDGGMLSAIDKHSGHVRWKRKLGRLAAASPAVGDGNVYAVALLANNSSGGRVAAFGPGHGHIVWSRNLPARAESSPLLHKGILYFGSEDGTVYAIRARDGRTHWIFHAGGAVKGGPALANGVLYFGDYGGHVYAVRAGDGHLLWSVGTSGTRFGLGSGNFYSTPAVAFGRVYLGNTDGRVYSFAAHSGKLAWATGTGAYVYSSAAVADIRGVGPTVYIGSYDGSFYAFDARSGAKRWSYSAGGRISGSPTIVGDVVYFSNLGAKNTVGLDVRTGRKVFGWTDGAFNPVVADSHAVYLVGYGAIYELLPGRARHRAHAAQRRRTRHRSTRG